MGDELEYLETRINGMVRHCPKCGNPYTMGTHYRDGTTILRPADRMCLYVGKGESVSEGTRMIFLHSYIDD